MNGFKLYLPGRLLCRISPRFHLWAICRAIGIKPYVWQRAFALGRINSLPGKRTPGNGKTTAVMLRLLMLPRGKERNAKDVLLLDPDFSFDRVIAKWYEREYELRRICCVLECVPVSNIAPCFFRHYTIG